MWKYRDWKVWKTKIEPLSKYKKYWIQEKYWVKNINPGNIILDQSKVTYTKYEYNDI